MSMVEGYDQHKETIAACIIPHSISDEMEATCIELSEPVCGVHKYYKQQALYLCIHRFITSSKWKPMIDEQLRTGSTWLELFVAFDIGGYRAMEAKYVLNEEAASRAKDRRKKLKAREEGRVRPVLKEVGAQTGDCTAKPLLRTELDNFKAIFRYIIRNELKNHEAAWFASAPAVAERRLAAIGVYGNQPAINAIRATNATENLRITRAIATHRTGRCIGEHIQAKVDGRIHAQRIKWARVETSASVKWQRAYASAADLGIDAFLRKTETPVYSERLLTCNVCQHQRETMHMKLRTGTGYRAVQCLFCHVQRWTGRMKCTCNTWWHLCAIRKVDPLHHKVMRRPTARARLHSTVLRPSSRVAPDICETNSRALKKRRVVPLQTIALNSLTCPTLAARFPHLVADRRESLVVESSASASAGV